MSFKKNIFANYVSQIYVTLIGIVVVPLYVKYMGAEAYGLVGFFATMQAWFQLLDMGLTPTMARATARFNGGATDALSLRRLLRALESIFIGVAALGSVAMMSGSHAIALGWLNVQQLSVAEVQNAIILMAWIIGLRWVCGLYRGAINGFEHQVWLSCFNSLVATARFVLVIPLFIYVGTSPTQFFSYQLMLAVIELVVLVTQTYRLLPEVQLCQPMAWRWETLRGVLKFSLSIAFTSAAWVLVTQTDKLVLSKLLPLKDYAYFTLAVLMAGGVGMISGPISVALLPRLTKLSAEGDELGLIRLYRKATQLVGVICIPAALVLTFFADQVIWAWTGDAEITRKAAPILALYALGNGILAIGAFPYYLQFSKGDLKLHMIGSGIFVVLLIPALVVGTWQYGAIGAGYAWLGANTIYFLTWTQKVHSRFVKGLHIQWILHDVGSIAVVTVFGAVLAYHLVIWPQTRIQVAIVIALVSFTLVAIASLGSTCVRLEIAKKWRERFARKARAR